MKLVDPTKSDLTRLKFHDSKTQTLSSQKLLTYPKKNKLTQKKRLCLTLFGILKFPSTLRCTQVKISQLYKVTPNY